MSDKTDKSAPKKISVKVHTAGPHPMWGANRQFHHDAIEVELTEHEVFQLKADPHFIVEGGPDLPEGWPHHAQNLGQHPPGSLAPEAAHAATAPAPVPVAEVHHKAAQHGQHDAHSWSDPAPEAHNRKGKG